MNKIKQIKEMFEGSKSDLIVFNYDKENGYPDSDALSDIYSSGLVESELDYRLQEKCPITNGKFDDSQGAIDFDNIAIASCWEGLRTEFKLFDKKALEDQLY